MSPHFLTVDEFPGYWDWLRYPGQPPVLVSIAFPPPPSISQCFSTHSSSAIGFHSCFFFTADVGYLHPFDRPFTCLWWVSRLGTGSGTRCCGPRAWGTHEAEI